MVNRAGRGGMYADEGGVDEKDVDGAGDGGTVESMDEMVGGPRFWGRDIGVVWRKEHVCPCAVHFKHTGFVSSHWVGQGRF